MTTPQFITALRLGRILSIPNMNQNQAVRLNNFVETNTKYDLANLTSEVIAEIRQIVGN